MLVLLSGVAVALYAVMSAVGLWLSGRLRRMARTGERDEALLSSMPPHHVDLLTTYGAGWRGRVWQLTIIALIACVLALLTGAEAEAAAAWFLAAALAGDCLLFFTFEGRDRYIARASQTERLADAGQCLVLLAALGILAWRMMNDG
jgi:hypothetical protein